MAADIFDGLLLVAVVGLLLSLLFFLGEIGAVEGTERLFAAFARPLVNYR